MLRHFSHAWLFVTPWTVASQPPLSMGFSRQKYCSVLPYLPSGDLSDPGIKPTSPTTLALSGYSLPLVPPGKPKLSGEGTQSEKLKAGKTPTACHRHSRSNPSLKLYPLGSIWWQEFLRLFVLCTFWMPAVLKGSFFKHYIWLPHIIPLYRGSQLSVSYMYIYIPG